MSTLRVVAATPISPDLVELVSSAEPRLDFVVEQDLLPPQRHAGDHAGDPSFQRSSQQQRRFDELLMSAPVLYGIPGERPSELGRIAAASSTLEWVQLMPAGGGAQVRGAHLTDEQLARIRFTTTAGVHEGPMAEFAVFGVLAGFKSLPHLTELQRAHDWPADRWAMRQVDGSRILLVGLGHIGRSIAAKLSALGATVAGTSRRPVEAPGVTEVIHPDDLVARVGEFDAVVASLPGTPATEGLIGEAALAAMRPDAVVVNVGRGTVIDEPALIAALSAGSIGFAALDVVAQEPLDQASPLWDLPNVLLSPHTAALNQAEDRKIAELFAANATRYLDGAPLINLVNTAEFY